MDKADKSMMTSYMNPRARWGCERERESVLTANQYVWNRIDVFPADANVANSHYRFNLVDKGGLNELRLLLLIERSTLRVTVS